MRITAFTAALLTMLHGWLSPAAGDEKMDYAALERLIHKMIAAQFPKDFEQGVNWGKTIPVPEKLRLPRLRTRVMVDGREELPHGLWRKVRAKMDDPAKNVVIRVRDLQPKGQGLYRLSLDVDAALRGEIEVVHWQKGLKLVNVIAQGDAVVGMAVECDVKVRLDPKQAPGKVKLEPTVTDVQLRLKDFALQEVALRRLGPVLQGEQAQAAGELLKGVVEMMLQGLAPNMKERFNEGIGRSLADGNGTVPTAELLKALSSAPKRE
jgi:hypothetical protein